MARRSYTNAEKARAYVRLATNEGNVKRTARELSIPDSTMKIWKKQWEEDGPPPGLSEDIAQETDAYILEATETRDLALNKIKELIPQAEVKNISAIGTIFGIIDDKITRARGLPTNKTEVVHRLPNPKELEEALAKYTSHMLDQQRSRSDDVIDAEFTEEQPQGLPTPKG